jgi:hypothetical protein
LSTPEIQSRPALGPPSTAVQTLMRRVASLCILGKISEDVATRLFREAYAHARSQPGESEAREFDNNIDVFLAGQVLSEWHQNNAFLDGDGNPKSLSISEGEFATLCRTASVESKPDRLLELLAQAGTVSIEEDRVTANRRELILDYPHPAAVTRAIRLSAEFSGTLFHNLSRNVREPGLFERTVVSTKVAPRQIPSLLAYLSVHGQSFLEDLDEWMSVRESTKSGPTIGVGVYVFVGAEQLSLGTGD